MRAAACQRVEITVLTLARGRLQLARRCYVPINSDPVINGGSLICCLEKFVFNFNAPQG